MNDTSYMMPPEALRNPRSTRQQRYADQSYEVRLYFINLLKFH